MAQIQIKGLTKSYLMGDTIIRALNQVDLEIQSGEFVAIMGPSGSGKSTLMQILGLLDVPNEGSYKLNGTEISKLSEDELSILRRKTVGFIFQQFNLLSRMTAVENVALPLLYSEGTVTFDKSIELLQSVGLGHRLNNKPQQMSGGQQQRVAIARSLINKPQIIFADEPTGNLDSHSEVEIINILKKLNSEGITIIIVTHEESVAQHADRIIRFKDGSIMSDERNEHQQQDSKELLTPLEIINTPIRMSDVIEHFQHGLKTLIENKSRTLLSILGIMIGVASVITMLALGNGAQKAIEKQLSSLGSNLLILKAAPIRLGRVVQDTTPFLRLSLEDVTAIRNQIDGVLDVSPTIQVKAQAAFLSKNLSTQLIGVSTSYPRIHSMEPEFGRFFNEDENKMRSMVAVIGATIARELFIQQNPIGEMIKINKVNFMVIGVLPEKGASSFRDQDNVIYIPVITAMKRMIGRDSVDNIEIEVASPENMDTASDAIEDLMISRHRIPISQQDSAFEVRNMTEVKEALSESNRTMSMLLAAIAAISLIVGGIGVMNIMLVSVTERTKEIGLRKSLGARRADILVQFLVESIVVSSVGGVCGIILGWLSTVTLSFIADWNAVITLFSVLLSFIFSVGIGIGFGIYPAQKASQLHPIEALRHD